MAEGIKYQNKDILFKVLNETYKNKSLKVFGLDLPPIKELLPTNLPVVQADEKRGDNIFLLSDDKNILILEYESSVDNNMLFKYGGYGFRVLESYDKAGKNYNLIIVVIYTGDIKEAPAVLNRGSIRIETRQVFLSKFDGISMYENLRYKVENNEPLSDEDVMKFIILPLTNKANDQKMIESSIELAKKVENDRQQLFIIAGILTAADKYIDKKYSNHVKEWIKMTQVARLFEEEKIDYGNQMVAKNRREFAKRLFDMGMDVIFVMKATGLTRDEINQIQNIDDNGEI